MSWRPLMAALMLMAGCDSTSADSQALPRGVPANTEKAIFAGGCFWCTESDFEKVPGVISAVSGFTGGHTENVRYEDTHDGSTGHTEAVEILFDPDQVSYAQLAEKFFRNHDPLDAKGQFCDRGSQYRPGIFFLDAEQEKIALAAKKKASQLLGRPLATEITKAGKFWKAERYHQDYYKKNALRYNYYRKACGRDNRIEAIWRSVPEG